MNSFTNTSPDLNFEGLTKNLKTKVSLFQEDPTPENFAHIISSLRDLGLTGQELLRQATQYTRQNPIRVALFSGLIFYAIKGLVNGPTTPPQLNPGKLH